MRIDLLLGSQTLYCQDGKRLAENDEGKQSIKGGKLWQMAAMFMLNGKKARTKIHGKMCFLFLEIQYVQNLRVSYERQTIKLLRFGRLTSFLRAGAP